ncbi:MAG: nucleotidyltransferase domain-containing protein [Bacteroidota bacterium]
MIETLISSKTRIKLLLKFFLNSKNTGYLRHLEGEFGESTNAIRQELNRFEKAGMLNSAMEGNKKIFQANLQHPLFREVNSIVMKYVGLDRIIEFVIKKLGAVEEVYLTGTFARGLDSDVIDLVMVGDVNQTYLIELIGKAEHLINRKIRYLLYTPAEFQNRSDTAASDGWLLLWQKDN